MSESATYMFLPVAGRAPLNAAQRAALADAGFPQDGAS